MSTKAKSRDSNNQRSNEPADSTLVLNCVKCKEPTSFKNPGVQLPPEQAAALGLSFTCRACKQNARIDALTEAVTELVKDKSDLLTTIKNMKEKQENTQQELVALREAHENLQFEFASKISELECSVEAKTKEVCAIQDFVGKLIPDDVSKSNTGNTVSSNGSEGGAKSYAEVVRGNTKTKLVTTGTCGELIAAELADREKRKNNLIVFNVKESVSEVPAERKQADIAQVDSLLAHLGLKEEVCMQTCVRIGVHKNANDDQVRPVLVKLRSQNERDMIMSTAYKCKGFHLGHKKQVGLCRDRTVSERREESLNSAYKKTKAVKSGANNLDDTLPLDPQPSSHSTAKTC